jgi:hypothetical protein
MFQVLVLDAVAAMYGVHAKDLADLKKQADKAGLLYDVDEDGKPIR